MFLRFLDKATPLVFKNSLRIILGSKSENFKNAEARQKGRDSYVKKEFTGFLRPRLVVWFMWM